MNERQEDIVKQRTTEILGYTVMGAGIGSSIGSVIPVFGSFIGGAIGAGIGFLLVSLAPRTGINICGSIC